MKHPPLRGHAIISFPSTSEVRDSNAMKIRSSSGRIYFRLRICLECLSQEQNYSMKPSEYRSSFHESYWRRRRRWWRRLLHYGLDIFGFSIFLRAPLLDVRIVKIPPIGAISFHVSRSSGNLLRRVDRCKRFGASSSSRCHRFSQDRGTANANVSTRARATSIEATRKQEITCSRKFGDGWQRGTLRQRSSKVSLEKVLTMVILRRGERNRNGMEERRARKGMEGRRPFRACGVPPFSLLGWSWQRCLLQASGVRDILRLRFT